MQGFFGRDIQILANCERKGRSILHLNNGTIAAGGSGGGGGGCERGKVSVQTEGHSIHRKIPIPIYRDTGFEFGSAHITTKTHTRG